MKGIIYNTSFQSPESLLGPSHNKPRLTLRRRLGGVYMPPFGRDWVVVLFLFFSSCDIDGEAVCEYNTRLIYRYNRENTTLENVLPEYIQSLDEYIFDQQGILVMINHLPGISCFGKYVSETNLPEGKYTVITWGNKAVQSKVNKEQVGITTKQEMMLYLDNPFTVSKSTAVMQGSSERLYYGYRTFSVEKYGVSKINIDMTHSHCVLNITVRWKKVAEGPDYASNFHMTIEQIPAQYMFMPEFVSRNETVETYAQAEDIWPSQSAAILHYIPQVLLQEVLVSHYNTMRMDVARQLRGQFVTYRYRNNSHELLTIYIDGNRLAGKTLDLYTFFKTIKIDLDKTLRQEYELLLEVDGDRITATMLSNTTGWNEGGYL
ncbi:FimB/Mfa2 family fimbrial subunit [Dysgonomonas sp. HGC4]|uniref:FimB/Mfa2 family fimbrial subunit n=1 Tax=Dysgonomonas sp. HGC4 TaxID=1658009 RepID=UPI0006824187|nr:FimB/Mfa2 family fimbrial subunit [Dysgonomonas sp. HGC4]MBD8347747.1 FimB/Mfa2 family fimbrial subunit [Dysgonomonas sp. HGC4]